MAVVTFLHLPFLLPISPHPHPSLGPVIPHSSGVGQRVSIWRNQEWKSGSCQKLSRIPLSQRTSCDKGNVYVSSSQYWSYYPQVPIERLRHVSAAEKLSSILLTLGKQCCLLVPNGHQNSSRRAQRTVLFAQGQAGLHFTPPSVLQSTGAESLST